MKEEKKTHSKKSAKLPTSGKLLENPQKNHSLEKYFAGKFISILDFDQMNRGVVWLKSSFLKDLSCSH